MKKEHLHLLIDEEIYLIDKGSTPASPKADVEQPAVEDQQEQPKAEEPIAGEKVQFAFIHQTEKAEELELLNKIISACKLDPASFKILKQGQDIHFQKAVIFSDSASSLYQPVKENEGLVMYSKPLEVLMHSREDKTKLWETLQAFTKE